MKLLKTNQIIKAGITHGLALEIGPCLEYIGLEWLKKTDEAMDLIALKASTE